MTRNTVTQSPAAEAKTPLADPWLETVADESSPYQPTKKDMQVVLREVERLRNQLAAADQLVRDARSGRLEVRPGSYADEHVRGQFAVADRLAAILSPDTGT